MASCGPGPAVVPAIPLPSTSSAAITASAPPSAKPVETHVTPIAPPPPSPVAQLLAHPPALPPLPSRTCPKLPKAANVTVPGKGSQVMVTVMDYLSLAPIADVKVKIFHGTVCFPNHTCRPSHPHPEEQLQMIGKTDAEGRAVFDVPDLDYGVFIPEDPVPGHLPFDTNYNMGKQECHALSKERRGGNGRALLFEGYLIPETMLRIRTNDDVLASAMQLPELVKWLEDHQDALITVRGKADMPEVGFGYKDRGFRRQVLINGFDGTARLLSYGD